MYKDFLKLRQDINECAVCPGAITAVKNFPFKGAMKWLPKHTKVMFIAQDPPTSGKYLYDGTNERFTKGVLKLLKAAGLVQGLELGDFIKAELYLTDILKCPRGKVENCKTFLRKEIRLLTPEVICTLGKKGLEAFLKSDRFKMKEYAGQFILPSQLDQGITQGRPVFCCYFPMKYPVSDERKIKHFRRLTTYLGKHHR